MATSWLRSGVVVCESTDGWRYGAGCYLHVRDDQRGCMINTVPTWDNIYTPLSFIISLVVGGLLLSQFVIVFANDSRFTATATSPCWLLLLLRSACLVTVGNQT